MIQKRLEIRTQMLATKLIHLFKRYKPTSNENLKKMDTPASHCSYILLLFLRKWIGLYNLITGVNITVTAIKLVAHEMETVNCFVMVCCAVSQNNVTTLKKKCIVSFLLPQYDNLHWREGEVKLSVNKREKYKHIVTSFATFCSNFLWNLPRAGRNTGKFLTPYYFQPYLNSTSIRAHRQRNIATHNYTFITQQVVCQNGL
jgi:hypothetical protein